MLRLIKNVWTLIVNLGWIIVVGCFAWCSVAPVTSEPTTNHVIAETPQPVVSAVPQPDPAKPPPTMQVVQRSAKHDRLLRAPEPKPAITEQEPAKQELPTPIQIALAPEDVPSLYGKAPNVNNACQGGSCQVDPRLKYSGEPRAGNEPQIYFPKPERPPGYRSPELSKAMYANDENRWLLNEWKAKLKWTPKIFKLLDLSEMGPCPYNLEVVYDQNYELTWRIRQVRLIAQGYEAEGDEPPRRPFGERTGGIRWASQDR
jgi:hypothetical protein